MAAPYKAKSLVTLLAQVNKLAPNRSKDSDGWIGDTAHQATKSEHNPNKLGAVRAIDITHDPAHGFDSWEFADMLRLQADPRVYYIISNGRIAAPSIQNNAWRAYNGKNPHDHHVHISVDPDNAKLYDDPKEWSLKIGDWNKNKTTAPAAPSNPVLKQGSKGDWVKKLQILLKMPVKEQDGDFGPKTKAAVVSFQKTKGLVSDGIVGAYTWKALGQ